MKSGVKSTSLKLKKRWFVLTSNSLDYYKSPERSASKLGTLVLNSLCSVVQPDEKVFKDTGQFLGLITTYLTLIPFCFTAPRYKGLQTVMGFSLPICLRLLEHNRARTQTLLPSLYQNAEWSHALGQRHPGSHRQQSAHRNTNTTTHQGY